MQHIRASDRPNLEQIANTFKEHGFRVALVGKILLDPQYENIDLYVSLPEPERIWEPPKPVPTALLTDAIDALKNQGASVVDKMMVPSPSYLLEFNGTFFNITYSPEQIDRFYL